MSGGHFDYLQYRLEDIAESIQNTIDDNGTNGRYDYDLSEKTIKEFKKGIEAVKIAETYIQRIDWLLSGDDGEENFHKRLKQDLEELKNQDQ